MSKFYAYAFDAPPSPLMAKIMTNVDDAFKQLKRCNSTDIVSRTANQAVKSSFDRIVQQRDAFLKTTRDTVQYHSELGTFAADVLEFLTYDKPEDVTRAVPILINQSKTHQSKIPDIVNSYKDIRNKLTNIRNNLDAERAKVPGYEENIRSCEEENRGAAESSRKAEAGAFSWGHFTIQAALLVIALGVGSSAVAFDFLLTPFKVLALIAMTVSIVYNGIRLMSMFIIWLNKSTISHLHTQIGGALIVINDLNPSLQGAAENLSQCYSAWEKRLVELRENLVAFQKMKERGRTTTNHFEQLDAKKWREIKRDCEHYTLHVNRVLESGSLRRKMAG